MTEQIVKQKFAEQFGRLIKPNEIIIECDNLEFGDYGIRMFGNILNWKGYKIELWKAQGQRSYHLHIRDIPFINELTPEQNKKYKELFIKKYILELKRIFGFENESWLNDFDFNLCGKHRIAEENKPHYKYKTIKKLIVVVNPEFENKAEKDLYFEAMREKPAIRKPIIENSITSQIVAKISIIDLAKRFGFKLKGNKAVCKFHADTKPSLSFNDGKGLFYCFGCCAKGNIVDFYALCKKRGFDKK